MLNYIIRFSVRNKFLIFIATALVVIWGMHSLITLPIDAVPDITNKQVQVNTSVEGWSAEEIEKTVTFPIESLLRGVPNSTEIRSLSRLGLSQVTIVFEDSVDLYFARQLVSERLQNVKEDLPDNIVPQLGPITTGLGEIYQYVVEFKNIATDPEERFKQLVELRTMQDKLIRPRLIGVSGVAEVNTLGGYEKQIHIVPDPKKLSTYGFSFTDIENAITEATQNVGGGYIEQDAEQFVVQAVGFLVDREEILDLPIKSLPNLQVITIGDVASVIDGKENRSGAATYNGNEAVLGTVMMRTGENSRVIAQRAEEKIKEISKNLPDTIEIKAVYSRSDLVDATISTVWGNVLSGAFLVALILFILAGNMRAAFITAFSIPLVLFIVGIVMKAFNISGNLISLGALDFGIIDGVVIVVDNCMRRLKEKVAKEGRSLTKLEIDKLVIDASKEIRSAAGFGQMILVVVFLPIFSLVGIEAKTFRPMALTFIIALLAVMILSVTLAPALSAFLLGKNYDQKEGGSSVMAFLDRWYQKLLTFTLDKFKLITVISIISVCTGTLLFKSLGAEFLPQLKEGAFAFHFIRPQNVSLSMSLDMQEKAEKLLMEYPEVSHVFSRIGTAEVATDPMGVNVSDTYIMFNNFGKGLDFDRFAETLLERLKNDLPGMNYLASQPIQMRFNELLEGSRADLTIKIFGDDLKELQELGEEIEELVKPISPTSDVELDKTSNFPVFTIEPNLKALKRYGVSKAVVLDIISMALSGEKVGYFFDKDKRFPIIIRLDGKNRKDIDVIKKLPVPIFAGTVVPLEHVADIGFKETYSSINRDDGYRRSTIMVNTRGIDTKTFVEKAQKVVKDNIKLPEGYFIEWGGQYKNLEEASMRFVIIVPVTLAIVFFMIYLAFHSVKKALLIFMGIPFALCGGIIGLYIAGLPFSISAAIGFIALMGIVVLNGIVLINAFDSPEYKDKQLKEVVINGSTTRLRAVLMTALTDVIGFIPMITSTGIGSEVQRPLAVVIFGGILTATALTLVVLPTVYYRVYKKQQTEILVGSSNII